MNADPTPPAAGLPENPPAAPAGGAAHTGCGILIVILVLVILAGMHPSGETPRMAVKSEARAGAMAILNAIGQFQRRYDRLPVPASAVKGADSDSDTSAEEGLVAILQGRDGAQNPSRLYFLGGIEGAAMEEGKWRSGLIQNGGLIHNGKNFALVDSWGNPYHVRLDGNGDGFVSDPNPDAAEKRLKVHAIVWSAGKDCDSRTWEDNISSSSP